MSPSTKDVIRPEHRRWRAWVDATPVVVIATALPAVIVASQLRPLDPTMGVAVVFAPWTTESEAVERATAAGAALVRAGGFPFVLIVRADGPGYIERVRAAGAWLALDPKVLALCAPSLSPT